MMRLPTFRYRQPKTVAEAVRMAADAGPEGMFVAGGTDLYPNMKRRQYTPKVVIGLRKLAPLQGLAKNRDGYVLGANLTLTQVATDPDVRRHYPAVARAAGVISTPVLRNMGTIGGNLLIDTRCNYWSQNYEWRKAIHFCIKKDGDTCWTAPSSSRCWAVSSSDSAPVMIALGAKVKLVSAQGERLIPAADLYRDDGIQYLSKRPDEILTEIHLPAPDGWKATYWKLCRRGSFDFPVLGVAAGVWRSADGRVRQARIVIGGAGSRPHDAAEAAQALVGGALEDAAIAKAAALAHAQGKPLDNTDLHMTWRKEMVRHYVTRALQEIRDRDIDVRFKPGHTI